MSVISATESLIAAQDLSEAALLAELVRALNHTGHNPATSGNYSLRSQSRPGLALVSESGIDKSLFQEANLLLVDQNSGELVGGLKNSGRKSSDETALHLAVYRATRANCVLHSHLLESLLFAELFPGESLIELTGLELLKGFRGVRSHEARVVVPCFQNTQDIASLAREAEKVLLTQPCYGILLRGHGLYVWGDSVREAKRHLEVFEYIFKYYTALRRLQP